MLSQRDSIIRLLSDEDTETAELVEKQLIARGAEILPELKELAETASGRVERRLRETMAEIERGVAEKRVSELCAAFHDESDIEDAAWLIASAIRPGEDFGGARALLDEWAGILKSRIADAETVDDQAEIIADLLGGQMFLRGNEDDYYNIENSLLPNVIESRLGIPLSVTLVYMLVAKRAGLRVEGVGLPGHFIARIGHAFLDPFHGGRRMHLEECRKLLRSQGSELQPHHLLPCPPKAILSRMLNNLLHIAVQEGDTGHAKLVQGWLKALQKGGE